MKGEHRARELCMQAHGGATAEEVVMEIVQAIGHTCDEGSDGGEDTLGRAHFVNGGGPVDSQSPQGRHHQLHRAPSR